MNSWLNYVWIAINLALIYYLARRFLSRPAGQFLASRRQDIVERFQQAEEAVDAAAQLRDAASERLLGVSEEKQRLLDEARQRVARTSKDMERAAQDEAARVRERARSGIGRERDLVVKNIWQRAAEMTIRSTRAVLGDVSGTGDDEKLVQDLVSGLKEVRQ